MARLAFERDFTLKQLKAKYDYHEFLPRHVDKRAKTLFVSMKLKLSKSIDSTLEETYNNFYCINNSPLRQSIISYLKELLQSVPTYVSLCANVCISLCQRTLCANVSTCWCCCAYVFLCALAGGHVC